MTDLSARPSDVQPDPRRSGAGFARALLILSVVCLPLGLTLPVLETTRLWVFKESYSLIEAVQALYEGGEIALAMLIAVFSLLTPVLKLVAVTWLHVAARAEPWSPLLRWVERLGKWSLTDVLVIAILIVVWSGTGLSLAVQPGLWFFAASAVLLMAASGLVVKDITRKSALETEPER